MNSKRPPPPEGRTPTPAAFRSRRIAVAAAAALAVAAPAARATGAHAGSLPYCTAIPLPQRAAATCRALEVTGARTTLRLAVAANEADREHGLMGVPVVPPAEGMIFAFTDGDQRRYFWMKNTIAPLDMIFVRADGVVTGVAADVPASTFRTTDDEVARRDGLGRYVIELAAGEAKRLALAPGVRLGIPPLAAR
ncbi:hypothetical protein WPS_32740 [Vulcanimicrobium alpinum]|uniref:DUF192 domain-containing protein n=1 Tax=Vulcanimicrobium alpinum TaxID=3016050 RepID=A0AAN1XZ15_UNVUL|nr:DUF192 domain-containing protein [Vulcanimicrobium alpinum]BDE07998.1 hypothetical protein WPS_32740 [Vulcanimicrobium alpinum]